MTRNDDICLNCERPVKVSIFKGNHYCSSLCFKKLTGGTYNQQIVTDLYAKREAR